MLSDWWWLCTDVEMCTATLTSEPVVLEQLEVIEALPQPTVMNASDIIVVTDEPMTAES